MATTSKAKQQRTERRKLRRATRAARPAKRNAAPKIKTREQVEAMQDKAIAFLRNVVGDDDKAADIGDLSVEEYAEKKHVQISNPRAARRAAKPSMRTPRGIRRKAPAVTSAGTRRRAARRKGRVNPDGLQAAAGVYDRFHGRPGTEVLEFAQPEGRQDFAALGILVSLVLKDWPKDELTFAQEGKDRVLLCSDAGARQLYCIGGDQNLSGCVDALGIAADKDFLDLGEVAMITYTTGKKFDNFEPIDYYHKLGEETGERPRLMFNRLDNTMRIIGGAYTVTPEGIVN